MGRFPLTDETEKSSICKIRCKIGAKGSALPELGHGHLASSGQPPLHWLESRSGLMIAEKVILKLFWPDCIIIGNWSHILPNRKICIMTTGQQIKSQIIDEAKSLAHLGDKKFSFSHILPSFHSPFGEPSSLLALDKCQN